jgi:hypothetical protein
MALRGIRSTVQRFVVVAGLTGAFLAGSVALGPRSDASAAAMHCYLAQWNEAIGYGFLNMGGEINALTAAKYFGRAEVFRELC